MRTTSSRIRFEAAFELGGMNFPPGEYLVEIDEETLDVMTKLAYRRTSVSLHVPSADDPGVTEIVTVKPAEFDAALRMQASRALHSAGAAPSGGESG